MLSVCLTEFLGRALIGLHTMRDEHFGIGVVELMASGVITIAHRSGGPLMDIVRPAVSDSADNMDQAAGYLCDTAEEYANAIVQVLRAAEQSPASLNVIQANARRHVTVRISSYPLLPIGVWLL
jgi:alpha-1,2-mannosyltransferase